MPRRKRERMFVIKAEVQWLKKRFRVLALLFFLFALAGLSASAFIEYGLYIFFWLGLGGALTGLFFGGLLRWVPKRLEGWIGIVALLHFVYVAFSFWQSGLERAQRIDWIWFFPWCWMSMGGLVAAGILYLLAKHWRKSTASAFQPDITLGL